MFSDTHFHFEHFATSLKEQSAEISASDVLESMAKNNCFFGLDIGTDHNDLLSRQACAESFLSQIKNSALADKARKFLYFSAGIWPRPEEIIARKENLKILEEQIKVADEDKSNHDILNRKIIAIGECGLDHHWNPSGADGRKEDDFDEKMFLGERELFEMQLELAKKMNLPVIVHSRDAFEDTLDCIKNVGYHNGIIHCYSYGREEAAAFLDLGWHISFSGSVTYTKKSKLDLIKELISYVPDDRILCETDSPYLAPVPFRGQICTPILVEHTYKFVSECRGVNVEDLCKTVDDNISRLFF